MTVLTLFGSESDQEAACFNPHSAAEACACSPESKETSGIIPSFHLLELTDVESTGQMQSAPTSFMAI